MLDKAQYRAELFRKRSNISCKDEKDNAICLAVLRLLAEKNCKSVFTYVSIRSEADTKRIIADLFPNCRVFVPFTDSVMVMTPLTGTDSLTADKMGNITDKPAEIYDGAVDAVLVPLLGFNRDLYRIGYGGGFYDRYLAKSAALKIGLAYDEQFLDFEPEAHDVPLDRIITPTTVIRRKNG